MKTFGVLVSTMNKRKNELRELVENMNIKSNAIIVNQIPEKKILFTNEVCGNKRFISVKDRGLSKSRNLALQLCSFDICALADDDMYYTNNYEKIILDAYSTYPDADIIAFVVDHENYKKKKKKLKEGSLSLLKTMKIQSVQITFKKSSIANKNIVFDNDFGAGSIYPWGEENIFLFDCKKRGLNIYYVSTKIATLIDTNVSSWSRNNTIEHYNKQGAIYYRMSKFLYPLLIIQFVLRKKSIYSKDLKWYDVLIAMFCGAKKYKKSEMINYE